MADVVCLGELLVDFVAERPGLPLEQVVLFRRAPGGAPANVACGAVKLGRSAAFVGKVGDDPFGRMLRETLNQVGVDTSHLGTTDEARTTLVFVGVPEDGHKDMCFYRKPGADMLLRTDEIDADWLRRAKAYHFGSISLMHPPAREATLEAARVAREAGLMVTFDPNYRPGLWPSETAAREAIRAGIDLADVVKIADEEWPLLWKGNGADFDHGAADVLARGPKLVIVSRGAKGCIGYASGDTPGKIRHRCEAPGFPIRAVETTGAGDGFLASLAVDLLGELDAGRPLERLDQAALCRVLRRANATGALTCTRAGAIPGLPTRQEVDRFLAEADEAGAEAERS